MAVHTKETWWYWLVPVNLTGIPGQKSASQSIQVVGPDNTLDTDAPGYPIFTPTLVTYGQLEFSGVSVFDNLNMAGITEFHGVLVFVDELATEYYGSIAENIGTESPYTVGADSISSLGFAYSGQALADGWQFHVGDFLVLNDEDLVPNYGQPSGVNPAGWRRYEAVQITGPGDVGDPIAGVTLNIQRVYPGETLPGRATFGSYLNAHAVGKNFFKLTLGHHIFKTQPGAFDLTNQIAPIYDCIQPNAMVAFVLAGLANRLGYSDFPYYGLVTQTRLGIRTCSGGEIRFRVPGTLAVATDADTQYRLNFDSTPRVLYAEVLSAPTGSSILIDVRISLDNGTTWTVLAGTPTPHTLEITDSNLNSYAAESTDPSVTNSPYGMEFPFPRMPAGTLVGVDVTQVGSTSPGDTLVITIVV